VQGREINKKNDPERIAKCYMIILNKKVTDGNRREEKGYGK